VRSPDAAPWAQRVPQPRRKGGRAAEPWSGRSRGAQAWDYAWWPMRCATGRGIGQPELTDVVAGPPALVAGLSRQRCSAPTGNPAEHERRPLFDQPVFATRERSLMLAIGRVSAPVTVM
jgi:hypothetical protein